MIESLLTLPDISPADEQLRRLVTTLTDPSARRWRERVLCARAPGQARLNREQTALAAEALAAVLTDQLADDTRDKREAACHRWPWFASLPDVALLLLANRLPDLVAAANTTTDSSTRSEPALSPGAILFLQTALIGLTTAIVCLPPLIQAALIDLADRRILRVRIAAAEALGHLRQPETVGALAAVLNTLSPRLRRAVETTLFATLPTLTFDHYGTARRRS
jgi:HEAT repeat protein